MHLNRKLVNLKFCILINTGSMKHGVHCTKVLSPSLSLLMYVHSWHDTQNLSVIKGEI